MGRVTNQTCIEANSKLKMYQFTVEVRPDPHDPRREAKALFRSQNAKCKFFVIHLHGVLNIVNFFVNHLHGVLNIVKK